jgi:hypothetical protein
MKKTLLFALMALACTAISSFAGELDNESGVVNAQQRSLAGDLPATIVVRVNKDDNSVAVLHSKDVISKENAASVVNASFVAMKTTDTQKSELDKDSSKSGWYFYFNYYNYYNPCYSYSGYNYYYQAYNSYNYGNYNYYYYRWY